MIRYKTLLIPRVEFFLFVYVFRVAGENLLILCLDLFLAGSTTTSDTLGNAFLYLSLNPEWMKILQDELDNVVGKLRSPTINDLPSLPKMASFLAEVRDFNEIRYVGINLKFWMHQNFFNSHMF